MDDSLEHVPLVSVSHTGVTGEIRYPYGDYESILLAIGVAVPLGKKIAFNHAGI